MNCDDSRIYLPAYLDEELDVAESLRVQKHLAECQDCQQAQDEQLVLRSALRDPDLRAYPSADFSKRIEAAVRRAAQEEARARRSSRFEFLRMESFRWMPAAAVLLLMTAIGAFLVTNSLRSSHQQLVASAVLAGHIRSLQAESFDRCAFVGPPHRQALVSRQAGFLAARAGPLGAGLDAGRRQARLCGWAAGCRDRLPAPNAQHQCVPVAESRLCRRHYSARGSARLSDPALERRGDDVLGGIRSE